ncbi:hypothetical protein H6G52_10500 [Limnothrix sp. FACHB-881]|uniref:hypothetical protein n=1 Tax=unclassified Limnothrix TaxID=2632864 RepID=UPI00130467E3|nr:MULTISPECIES: hypothetical protein [unclassified Limnothrix]MBD2159872.1 hypothetical protein [Limnothrix sp. FACHB-1083]MBD2190573.1 hypothetical protein [Limnothrix sp. FACHB-1088]MBD2554635.1 hypothetical protein [Limnothrix sp. FACHB-708]MBD2591668.1 hypothetical protein [Limnothrix sp. FACHB-406]MBD2635789.1 hypothetical protein [Limnothrix sp. FACHB-881]
MPAGQEAGDRPEGANLHRNPTTSYPVLPRCGFGVAAGLGAIALPDRAERSAATG